MFIKNFICGENEVMSRTDDILDKTKRGEPEAKKWKVVVGIVVGLIVGCVLFYGLFITTESIVKNHYNTLDIAILYDFYDEKVGLDETSVYVIGNSIIGTATYAPLIDEIMVENGYDISTYNCYIDGTTSLMTGLQIDSLIESNPSLVIYGVSYNTFPHNPSNQSLTEEKILFSKDKFALSDDFKQYYTDEELDLLENHVFDLKGYLGRVIFPTNTRTGNYDTKEPIGVERRLAKDKSKNYEEIVAKSKNFNPTITSELTREKGVFVHSVEKMLDAGIKVVVINMPIHPLLSENVSDDSRQNLLSLLHSTNATVIDMETLYGDEHFFDTHHSTYPGALEFSKELAGIIIQEMS